MLMLTYHRLSKDCAFETCVTGTEFDEKEGKWTVKTVDGRTAKARFMIVAAGCEWNTRKVVVFGTG